MPNPCPSCSSTPELLLGLRPDRLPGCSPASPAAKWPFCRLREKNKNMKAGVIKANWGSKTDRSIFPVSFQAVVRALGEGSDNGSRDSTHS